MSRMKVKVKSCKFSLFREIFFVNLISPSSPTPPLSPLPSPIPPSPPVRHGICHECMEIVLVKYYFSGGKLSFKNMLFVVKSLFVVAMFICFS